MKTEFLELTIYSNDGIFTFIRNYKIVLFNDNGFCRHKWGWVILGSSLNVKFENHSNICFVITVNIVDIQLMIIIEK